MSERLPTEWDAASSLGSAIPPTATGPAASSADDPLAAWRTFWRAVGTGVPAHVNRSRRLRAGIRRLGMR